MLAAFPPFSFKGGSRRAMSIVKFLAEENPSHLWLGSSTAEDYRKKLNCHLYSTISKVVGKRGN